MLTLLLCSPPTLYRSRELDDEGRRDVFELLKRLLVALVDSRDSVVDGTAVCRAICELLCQPEKEVFRIRPSHLGVVVKVS